MLAGVRTLGRRLAGGRLRRLGVVLVLVVAVTALAPWSWPRHAPHAKGASTEAPGVADDRTAETLATATAAARAARDEDVIASDAEDDDAGRAPEEDGRHLGAHANAHGSATVEVSTATGADVAVGDRACPEYPSPKHMLLENGQVDYWLCMHEPREDIYISLFLFDGKLFEDSKTHIYLQLLHKTPSVTVLDLGANLGYFAILAAAMGHHVIALEPMPHNFRLLEASTALNQFGARVRLINKAGGPTDDLPPLQICANPTNQGDSAVYPPGQAPPGHRCHEVAVTTLNAILKDEPEPPMLVKSDTQGYDAFIMDPDRGGSALWSTTPPAVVLLEWEPQRIRVATGVDPVAFIRRIHTLGYVVRRRSVGMPPCVDGSVAHPPPPPPTSRGVAGLFSPWGGGGTVLH